MARYSSHSRLEAAKDDHRLPACLSLNFLKSHLYRGCEVVNATVEYKVSTFSRQINQKTHF